MFLFRRINATCCRKTGTFVAVISRVSWLPLEAPSPPPPSVFSSFQLLTKAPQHLSNTPHPSSSLGEPWRRAEEGASCDLCVCKHTLQLRAVRVTLGIKKVLSELVKREMFPRWIAGNVLLLFIDLFCDLWPSQVLRSIYYCSSSFFILKWSGDPLLQ